MFFNLKRSPFFRHIAKFILEEPPKHLGRWHMEDCPQRLKTKIDLANEDHCGPCGQYVMDKMQEKINDLETKISNIEKPAPTPTPTPKTPSDTSTK